MENIRRHIYLGALLHDIGRFYQRANLNLEEQHDNLSVQSKQIVHDIYTSNEFTYCECQHIVWTNIFLQEVREKLKEIPSIQQSLNSNESAEISIESFACNYLDPKTELQAIITMANWWSTGIKKTKFNNSIENKDNTKNIQREKQQYEQIPLYSIFNQINNGNYNSVFYPHALTLKEKDFFPQEIEQNEGISGLQQYNEHWGLFLEEFKKLPTDSLESFSESLFFLLKKYTWCIPADTTDMINVSLFDHLKTTAAFADCLYLYKKENPDSFIWDPQNKKLSLEEGNLPVILLGGDLSGIQKFIYNIASRKAAVSLKGRSFYLQLLIDTVIQRIISHPDINCSVGQVVYSSGGKFYMLLPNTDKVIKAIESLRIDFESELWEKHHGHLLLNIAYIPFSFKKEMKNITFNGLENAQIGDLWKSLADKLTIIKNRKFKTILLNKYEDLFIPQNVDIGANVCAVTGIEGKCVSLDSEENEEKTFVLKSVKEQIELGTALKGMDYLFTYKDRLNCLSKYSKYNISIFQTYNYLFDKEGLTDSNLDFRSILSSNVSRVKMINKFNFLDVQINGGKVCYGFQFYGGNVQARNKKGINKTFDQLADGSYLGILRMDVDGLGNIFINGLPQKNKSFASYSSLSFMLDYFFSGYLNTIREKEEFKDDVNILYSGGDDVFAVGKWDKLILFAEAVRIDFCRFVGRKDISISGGIVFVGKKYPIAKAALLAGEAEDAAKSFSYNGEIVKNAFNMFGENVSWDKEFSFVKDYKDRFCNLIIQEKISHAILHRLMLLSQKMKNGQVSYIWHTFYFLKRLGEEKNKEIQTFCYELQQLLCDKRKYELIALSARWAEFELRFKNK